MCVYVYVINQCSIDTIITRVVNIAKPIKLVIRIVITMLFNYRDQDLNISFIYKYIFNCHCSLVD